MFKLEISTSNAAFEDDSLLEISRLLAVAAKKVEEGDERGTLLDINGNTVGTFQFTED